MSRCNLGSARQHRQFLHKSQLGVCVCGSDCIRTAARSLAAIIGGQLAALGCMHSVSDHPAVPSAHVQKTNISQTLRCSSIAARADAQSFVLSSIMCAHYSGP
eukprot:6468432-Amphidinium_carterae.3